MATKAKSTSKKTKTASKKAKSKAVAKPAQVKVGSTALPGAFDLIKSSKDAFVLNIGIFLAIFFIPFLIVMAGGLLAFSLVLFAFSARSVELTGLGILLFVICAFAALIVGLILAPAIPYTQLQSVRKQKVGLKQVFAIGSHYFWRFIGLGISVGFVVFIGLLLFIVPGIIMIRRYFLSAFFLVDNDLKVFESMRRSSKATKENSGAVWGVIGVNFLFGLTGVIPWLGGIIAAVLQAIYSCAPALRYEQLKDKAS